MTNTKKQLNGFSWIYFVIGILTLILTISVFLVPDVANEAIKSQLNGVDLHNLDSKLIITIVFAIEALVNFLYFGLMRSVAASKSKGTFLMILLVISIVGSVFSLFKAFSVTSLLAILLDIYILSLVLKARKEA